MKKRKQMDGDDDEELDQNRYVSRAVEGSVFKEVFDVTTGFRVETTGAEEAVNVAVEADILRNQQKIIMTEATNYTGHNIKISKGEVKINREAMDLRRVLEKKEKLQAELYAREFQRIDNYIDQVIVPQEPARFECNLDPKYRTQQASQERNPWKTM